MSPTLQLLLLLGIIIFAAKTGGIISTRLGQPAVLGELLAGLALGPTLFDLLGQPIFAGTHVDEMILQLGELGVIFLVFVAGLEVDLEGMLQSGRVSFLAALFGVVATLALGTLVALTFGYPFANSVFIGLTLTATSISISAQTLLEIRLLRSKEGIALLGAAVIDDVIDLFALSIFVAFASDASNGAANVMWVAVRMFVFLALAIVVGLWLVPRATRWIEKLPISEGVMAFVVIATLFYAWSAEAVGEIAAITGAFLAGLFFARTSVRHTIEQGMHTLTYAFFVPLFLIGIGLKANVRAINTDGILFALAIIGVAILGKTIGCGIGARLGGFNVREALRVGVGMVSRGEVQLIVAAIGLRNGWINQSVYSGVVVVVLATALLTPILLRRVFPHEELNNGEYARARA